MPSPSGTARQKTPSMRRSRLAVACNACREAKGRCDVSDDACRRCQERGYDCIATDPKTGETISRRLARTALGKQAKRRGSHVDSSITRVPESSNGPNAVAHSTHTLENTRDDRRSAVGTCSPYGSTANGPPTTSTHPDETWPSTFPSMETAATTLSDDRALEVGAVQNNDGGRRHAVLGSTNMQVLAAGWIDRYFAYLRQPFRVSGCFKHGMRHAVEGGKPRDTMATPNVSPQMHEAYFDAYDRLIHPLFPVLDTRNIPSSQLSAESDEDYVCLRAALLAIYSLGADSIANSVTPEGTAFLYEAYSLITELINYPYTTSIQALILISLAFWSRAKDGQAGLAMSLAIKMAQSLGFHRHIQIALPEKEPPTDQDSELSLNSRIWWCLYCLDIVSSLASGNPRSINDGDSDRPLPAISNDADNLIKSLFYFKALIRLCRAISELGLSPSRTPPASEVDGRTQLLHQTVKADDALKAWYQELPMEIKSGALYSSPADSPLWTYIILYYYQCLILVHRTALTTREESYRYEVAQRYQLGSREYRQMIASQACCYDSALSMIKIFHSIDEHGIACRLIPISHISYAAVVLSIWILKHPSSGFQAVNMANLEVACNYAQNLYKKAGQDPRFSTGWSDWYFTIHNHLSYQHSAQAQHPALFTPQMDISQPVSLAHQGPGEPPRTPVGSNYGELGDSEIRAALDAADLDIWDWSTFFDFPVELNTDVGHCP